MKRYRNVQSFRPPSRDPRQISGRNVMCENPPTRFLFTQMTAGLEECYARINSNDGKNEHGILKNETVNEDEEEFLPVPGTILASRYKVIAKAGEGQSSVLVKAQDTFHPKKRYVAVKILHASYRNLGPQEASCLLHLKKADTLNIANIAHVLNTFTVGNHFCIVFEFFSPTPLYKYFQVFPFSSKAEKINLIRRIAFQVTQCLAVLSSLNIIHSDIKPENILFADGDTNDVKIIDFGNAIYWVHDEMSLYFDSFELQTVFYRAPEVMFGLPFGPQIDMWSLGCVLAELYLGEPLFLATSKDEILEKMQALLGPLPMTPFQSGKYFSNFKNFVSRSSSVPGSSKNVVNILKKLGSTDYIFADFIARLLAFDPSLRLSPTEAARHPFLAPECALGFMLPPGNMTQESTYSSVCLTPATYPHRPKIDEKIKKLHYSALDLLRVGTQANRKDSRDNVMKVMPFNYHEDLIQEEKYMATNSLPQESRDTVGNNVVGRFSNDETASAFGVSTKDQGGSEYPVSTDRRDNPYNESCSVLRLTEATRSVTAKVETVDMVDSFANMSHKEEFCNILNPASETRSSGTKEENKDVFPTRRTTRTRNTKRKSITNEMKYLMANSSEGSDTYEICVSKTKDKLHQQVSESAVDEKNSQKTQHVHLSGVKNDSQTKTREDVSSRGKEEIKTSPGKVNLLTRTSYEVSQNFDMSTAGGSRDVGEDTIVNTQSLKSQLPKNLLSAQRSNLQLSENEDGFCVTSSSECSNPLKIESNNSKTKNDISTKSSTLESFFDAFSEIDTVTSSTKLGELQTRSMHKKPSSSKRRPEIRKGSPFQGSKHVTSSSKNSNVCNLQMPFVSSNSEDRLQANIGNSAKRTKASNFREFSDDENNSFEEELVLVTFSNKQENKLQTTSDIDEKKARREKSPNVQEIPKEDRGPFAEEIMPVSSSNKHDRLPIESSRKKNITTKLSNYQSFDGVHSLGGGSSLIQDSKRTALSMGINEAQSPELRKKESVFDTPSPCTIRSKAGLLPGGLSDVEKKTCRTKKDNLVSDKRKIFDDWPVGSENVFNEQAQISEGREIQKRYKSFKSNSSRKQPMAIMRRTNRLKSGYLSRNESRESKDAYKRNTHYPGNVLTKETTKQARKRKLDFHTVNSPGKPDDLFGLESVADRQTAKSQKLSVAGLVERREFDIFARKDRSSSKNKLDNENKKQNSAALTVSESKHDSSFNDIFRRKEQSEVSDHDTSSDEEYEVLLL